MRSYYSIMQYCPDHSRLEVANIGLVLFSPDHRLRVRVAENNDRVARFFGKDSFVEENINAAKNATVERLLRIKPTNDCAQISEFIATRANDIILTSPRSVKIDDPDQDIERMFTELVL